MITKETRLLPCILSPESIQANLTVLEQLNQNVSRIDEMDAIYAAEIKAARAHNSERIKLLTREIQKRAGVRPVICEWRPNVAKNHFEVVRTDTGKVVEVVPMPADQVATEADHANESKIQPMTLADMAEDGGLTRNGISTVFVMKDGAESDGQNHADVLEGKA